MQDNTDTVAGQELTDTHWHINVYAMARKTQTYIDICWNGSKEWRRWMKNSCYAGVAHKQVRLVWKQRKGSAYSCLSSHRKQLKVAFIYQT